MKIDHKSKMQSLEIIHSIAQMAGLNLIDEIRKFDIPEKVGKYKVKDYRQLSIVQMMMLWEELIPATLSF